MEGILIVAHGSRAKETETTFEQIVELVKTKLPQTPIEHAYMEFSDKTLEKGVSLLVDKGVSFIKIMPYFLFSGIHLREDIPNMAEQCSQKYPGIKIVVGESLGTDERLSDVLVDRIMA